MQPGAATKRILGAALAVAFAACSTVPPRYEPGTPSPEQAARLKAVEAAYRAKAPDYPAQRDAIAPDPVAVAWLVRMFIRDVFAAREGRPLGEDDELLRAATKREDPLADRAIAEIQALGAAAVPTLVGDLLQHDQPQPRELGVELLGAVGQPAKPALLPLAQAGPPKQRRAAIRALGRIGFDAEGLALARAMAVDDADYTVRADALRSLRGAGPAAQQLLTDRLQADPDPYVRRVAAATLAAFPTTAAAQALVDFLAACERANDKDGGVAAQRALRAMAGTRAARSVAAWREWAAGVDARAAGKQPGASR
jgi:HEAT repeat protein